MHPYCDTRVHHILVSHITVLCSIVNITNSFGNLNPCHQCCQSRADCSNYSGKYRERNKLNCYSKFIMICCRCIIISIVRCISIEWVFTIVYCTTIFFYYIPQCVFCHVTGKTATIILIIL